MMFVLVVSVSVVDDKLQIMWSRISLWWYIKKRFTMWWGTENTKCQCELCEKDYVNCVMKTQVHKVRKVEDYNNGFVNN